MEKQIAAGLRQLNESVDRIDALLSWLELEREQQRGKSETSFEMASPTMHDLKQEIGAYFSLFFDMVDALKASPRRVGTKLEPKLQAIHKKFNRLDIVTPFYP